MRRSILPLTISALLVATGCAGDAPDGADGTARPTAPPASTPTDVPTSDSAPSSAPDDGSAVAPDPDGPSLAAPRTPPLDSRCVVEVDVGDVDRIAYAVPAEWQVDDRCDLLDPTGGRSPSESEAEVAVTADVTEVAFPTTVEPGPATTDEVDALGARSNRQVLRRASVSTGAAASPDGQPTTAWFFDLDAGTDEAGGTFVLSTARATGETYDLARTMVDEIAGTVVIDPPAPVDAPSGDGSFAVLRTEGGGTPVTVTHDDGCFSLRPGGPTDEVTEQLCDLDPVGDDPIVAADLGGFTVGFAPPATTLVEGDEQPGGLATSIEGGSVFAIPTADLPTQLTAIGPGDEPLGSITPRS